MISQPQTKKMTSIAQTCRRLYNDFTLPIANKNKNFCERNLLKLQNVNTIKSMQKF